MLYEVLREAAGVALRWYYSEITVRGAERIPRRGPLLVVGNHPNALIDALLIGWALPRRMEITAKATIFANPLMARFLRAAGVIPLRRVSDESKRVDSETSVVLDPARNRGAFRAVVNAFERDRAVLIFPEGKSHDDPAMAPIKTGPARMALEGAASPSVEQLRILPVGLVFERKEAVRSRVLVEIGEPFEVDPEIHDVARLTAEIDQQLRRLTLDYPSWEAAAETAALAALFRSLLEPAANVGETPRLAMEVDIARRVRDAREQLGSAPAELAERVRAFLERLQRFSAELERHGLEASELGISLGIGRGARFALREVAVFALGGPVALWGRLNHWIPFTAARAVARHDITSRDQPAMHTIVAGFVLVLVAYIVQTAVAWWVAGAPLALAYLLSLPLSADVDLKLRERLRRAVRRMQAWFALRSDRLLAARLTGEREALTGELLELEAELVRASGAS